MSEADDQLADHNSGEVVGFGGTVFDPVAHEQEAGGDDDRGLGPMFVQDVECRGRGDAEGEQKSRGHPVDVGLGRVEVLRRRGRDGREGDPVPGYDDIEQDELREAKESTFVHLVGDVGSRANAR